MNSQWIENALLDFPDNTARIPWAIHKECTPEGTTVVVEINVRTDELDECIVVESSQTTKAVNKALIALRNHCR